MNNKLQIFQFELIYDSLKYKNKVLKLVFPHLYNEEDKKYT